MRALIAGGGAPLIFLRHNELRLIHSGRYHCEDRVEQRRSVKQEWLCRSVAIMHSTILLCVPLVLLSVIFVPHVHGDCETQTTACIANLTAAVLNATDVCIPLGTLMECLKTQCGCPLPDAKNTTFYTKYTALNATCTNIDTDCLENSGVSKLISSPLLMPITAVLFLIILYLS